MADSVTHKSTSSVFLNGEIVPATEARLPITDQGLLYGFGLFETFRTSGGHPHHWQFNRTRLEAACAKAGLVLPPTFLAVDEARLAKVVQFLLQESRLADAVFRYTVTAGSADLPSELMALRPLPSTSASQISLRILNLRRDAGEWIPRPKSLNYLNAILGTRELRNRNAAESDEGLFLSREGEFVVETARQNLAWISGGRMHVPDASVGPVAGTCLAWIRTRGLQIEPSRATLGEFLKAEAIFVLNSVRGITPVGEVWNESDTQLLGAYSSVAHPLIMTAQREWQEALEETAKGRKWP